MPGYALDRGNRFERTSPLVVCTGKEPVRHTLSDLHLPELLTVSLGRLLCDVSTYANAQAVATSQTFGMDSGGSVP